MERKEVTAMRLRKLFAAAALVSIVSVLFVMPVSAHHGHRRQVTVDKSCPVCTVEGCTEEGRHLHDDEYYCGYDHACGYCDGSCAASSTQTYSGCGRRHHGCH